MEVSVPYTPFYRQRDINSELTTECLFGESIEVLKKDDGWVFGRLHTDNYLGWTHFNNLSRSEKKNYRVIVPRTTVHLKPHIKSKVILLLSLGSLLNVVKKNKEWSTVTYYNQKQCIGYVPSQHIVELYDFNLDWVSVAEKLIGTPYKWGGRNTLALDCSALVQLSLHVSGINFPRDTSMQCKLEYKSVQNIKRLKRGMLIFWQGHVAIALDQQNILHSNSYFMNTNVEPFHIANKRIESSNSNVIKILDLNG